MKDGFGKVPSVKVNLIFCMMRHFSFEDNYKIIQLTKEFLGKGVVAIDLAGDEANYKTSNFEKLFEIVNKERIPFTIHAGEASGCESVVDAINFGAKRIGHGISSIESNVVVNKLINEKIVLEICPSSNVDTDIVVSMDKHPIKALVNMGVLVTINTDNRTVSNTNLNREYRLLNETFGFTDEDFLQFNMNAIEAAFISDDEKEVLKRRLLK